MENLWIFYSFAGLVALGLGDFIKKVVLQKGGNKEVFLFMCFVFSSSNLFTLTIITLI